MPRNRTLTAGDAEASRRARQVDDLRQRLLTIPEAAEQLGASENHVYRLIAAGDLRAVDIAQRGSLRSKTRVRSGDIDAYIDQRTRKVTA